MTFPLTPNLVDVELYYSSTWNNINSYTFHRDASPITITRGRTSEGRACDPGTLTLSLKNTDGRFSPRNPNSPLFGLIGRNTPIRVKVTYGATTYTRFVGEVTSWPSRWDVSGRDVWVPIEAAGILRRLGQGSKPIKSALTRSIQARTDSIAYWPLEDEANATQAASALEAVGPLVAAGTLSFGVAADAPVGSAPLLDLADGGSLSGVIPPGGVPPVMRMQALMRFAEGGAGTAATILSWSTPGATYVNWTLGVTAGGLLTADGIGPSSSVGAMLSVGSIYDGLWHRIEVGARYNEISGDVITYLDVDSAAHDTGPTSGGAGETVNRPSSLSINPANVSAASLPAIGHVRFSDTDVDFDLPDPLAADPAMNGWDGDRADDRFERLCTQLNMAFDVIGTSTTRMGPERIGPFLQAARDVEATDQGILFEMREALGLALRTNSSRYSQVPIALDYDVGHISAPFDPEPDDRNIANDREVKRRNGSSARRELTSGPLSTQDPPDGVGRYDDSITVDAYLDSQLVHIANWRLHVGTWDAERYPRVKVDLAVPGNSGIVAAIAGADSGDLITIDNLPAWLPPERADLLIEGYRENIGFYTWDFTFNCSPAGPYNVVGRWPLISKELHTAMNTSVTSADIANTSTTQPMLEISAALIGSGYPITIGGEQLQLTAVAASLATFGSAGTASTGGSGSRTPGLPASAASGNLILIFASTRNSGTGSVDTPTDWTRLPIFAATSNCAVFGRIYDGVWTMPTVTYTAGAANEDTIAQSLRLGGKWHSVANVCIAAAPKLNASAQNIAYPGMPKPACDNAIVLYFGWKQDDYTSVTSPGTEVQESSTTTGNDASQVWSYTIQTTATAIAPGSFTVTGGASAISRGAVAFLRCDYQTATVTRSTNGVSASHSAADAVTATNPLRWGLL